MTRDEMIEVSQKKNTVILWCECVSAYVTTVHRDSERESATAGCLLMFVE